MVNLAIKIWRTGSHAFKNGMHLCKVHENLCDEKAISNMTMEEE